MLIVNFPLLKRISLRAYAPGSGGLNPESQEHEDIVLSNTQVARTVMRVLGQGESIDLQQLVD
jgi:hypothetical protein